MVGVFDFSKAYDTVPHDALLHKLDAYGIRDKQPAWIKAFVTERHMYVIFESETDSEATVKAGVSQGTVFGPLLFLTYINDLPDSVSSTVRLFADDCQKFRYVLTPFMPGIYFKFQTSLFTINGPNE